jgi:pimeloyl-ACP methyl ester carboxylesterase
MGRRGKSGRVPAAVARARDAVPSRVREAVPSGVRQAELPASARRVARERLEGVLPSTYPAMPHAAKHAGPDYGEPATPSWRDVDWSRHLHDVEIDDRPVHYVDIGEGYAPPVVFVHGLAGNWQNWLENIPRLAQGRRVLALDLPGFGSSPKPASDISIPGYAQTVEAWLDRLGLGRVVLVGNSMGGFVTAEVAIRYPERVERLALVAAAGISITNLRRRPTLTVARIGVAVGAVTAARRHEIIARERLRHLTMSTVFRHPGRMRADLLYEVLQGSGKPGFFGALDALTSYDFRDRLSAIECPTLILWGREDVLVPVKDADEFDRLIPRSREVLMDDTGHVPMLERPAAFNECLIEFLAEEAEAAAVRDAGAAEGAAGQTEVTSDEADAAVSDRAADGDTGSTSGRRESAPSEAAEPAR